METKNYIGEIWKPVIGYYGLYEVSNFGRVRSLDHYVKHGKGGLALKKGKILRLNIGGSGYYQVSLSRDNKIKSYSVHRLVAEAFIPNPHNYPCVNHRNENKLDDRVENLEWCDHLYNVQYGTGIERQVSKRSKPVLMFTQLGHLVREFKSVNQAARELGIWASYISDFCKYNKRNINLNYVFKYK